MVRSEEPQRECGRRQHGAVNPMPALTAKGGVLPPHAQQIDVEGIGRRVRLPLVEVQLASLEGRLRARVVERALPHERRDARKLRQKLSAAFAHRLGQLALEVGEVHERRRGVEFLALKQHRRARSEQQQRRHRAPPGGARQRVAAHAARRVRDLIVVLQKRHERRLRQMQRGSAAHIALPVIVLALKEEAVLRRGDELLRLAACVAVVRLAASGQRHHRTVVKVVVPQRVDPVAALFQRPDQPRVLRLVLRHDEDRTMTCRSTRAPADCGQQVLRRPIEDLLRGVEPQAVEMKLVDPVAGIADEELAHRRRVVAVEVEGVAPFVVVALGEVRRREGAQVVADRPEVVVDHVEDDRNPRGVRRVDEPAEVVRTAVEMRRRKEVHTVVAPAEAALELGDGHHFNDGDADARQLGKLSSRRGPPALARERADMQLVDDLPFERHAPPLCIRPGEACRIDDFRWTVRPLRLKSRRRIGIEPFVLYRFESIEIAGLCIDFAAEVPRVLAVLGLELCRSTALEHDREARHARRPDPHVRAAVAKVLGPHRQAALSRRRVSLQCRRDRR